MQWGYYKLAAVLIPLTGYGTVVLQAGGSPLDPELLKSIGPMAAVFIILGLAGLKAAQSMTTNFLQKQEESDKRHLQMQENLASQFRQTIEKVGEECHEVQRQQTETMREANNTLLEANKALGEAGKIMETTARVLDRVQHRLDSQS